MLIPKRYVICCFAFIVNSFVSIFQANIESATDYISTFGKEDIYNGTLIYRYGGKNWTLKELKKTENTAGMGSLVGATTAIVFGALASRYGGSSAFGIGVFVNALNNILTPLALATNIEWFIFNRFVNGAFHMLTLCALSDLWSRWSHDVERSRLVIIAHTGLLSSAFVHHIISNMIAYWVNWQCIFYITGTGGIILAILWLFYVKNDPNQDEKLPEEEKTAPKINRMKLREFPWIAIVSSPPVWALGASGLLLNCHIIFTYIQIYLKEENFIDDTIIQSITKWMTYSYLVVVLIAAWLADHLRNKHNLTDTKIRKGYICSAYFLASLLLCAFSCSPTLVGFTIFFCIFELCRSISDAALLVNVIDLSPQYSSLLNGLYWTMVTIGTILHKWFIGDTVKNNELAGWEFCWVFYFLLYAASVVLYRVWGSAEPQPWKIGSSEEHENKEIELG